MKDVPKMDHRWKFREHFYPSDLHRRDHGSANLSNNRDRKDYRRSDPTRDRKRSDVQRDYRRSVAQWAETV